MGSASQSAAWFGCLAAGGWVLADHGWHTVICVAAPPVRTGQDALDAFVATLPTEQDLIVVPHSNAGVYVPELVMQRRVVGAVFVDAVLPPGRGYAPLAPPAFLDLLREKADDDGLLPGVDQLVERGRRDGSVSRRPDAGASRN